MKEGADVAIDPAVFARRASWQGRFELFDLGDPAAAAKDLAKSFDSGTRYRMTSLLLEEGIAAIEGKSADKRSMFAPSTLYVPIVYEVAVYLYVARLPTWFDGDKDQELAKNLDTIAMALRPIGSLSQGKKVYWPGQVGAFFLNKMKRDDLIELATSTQYGSHGRLCAADFLLGTFFYTDR